jgi:hypothetical protein
MGQKRRGGGFGKLAGTMCITFPEWSTGFKRHGKDLLERVGWNKKPAGRLYDRRGVLHRLVKWRKSIHPDLYANFLALDGGRCRD